LERLGGISPHIPSAIIRAWKTDFRSPHSSLPYPIIQFNADSASAECSAITIAPPPDESRILLWTIRRPDFQHSIFIFYRHRPGLHFLRNCEADRWIRSTKAATRLFAAPNLTFEMFSRLLA
jgi:hypothetical protein